MTRSNNHSNKLMSKVTPGQAESVAVCLSRMGIFEICKTCRWGALVDTVLTTSTNKLCTIRLFLGELTYQSLNTVVEENTS